MNVGRGHEEQIGRYNGPCAKRDLKRRMRRAERRLAKRLLDDAPKRRPYRGWGD